MNKGLILGDNLGIREPTMAEKLEFVRKRCESLDSKINGLFILINDFVGAVQDVFTEEEKHTFKVSLYCRQLKYAAQRSVMMLRAGDSAGAIAMRGLLDGEYKHHAKELKCQSTYNKIMRDLATGKIEAELDKLAKEGQKDVVDGETDYEM